MKKSIVLCSTLTIFGLVGCSNSTETQPILQEETNQVQEVVENSQQSVTTPTTDGEQKTPNQEQETSTVNQQQADTSVANDKELKDLQTRVANLVEETNNIKPTGGKAEQRNQFFAAEQKLDMLDEEVDNYNDLIENRYQSGQITHQIYQATELEIEKLESQLEVANDSLESRFGIYD